MRPEIAANEMRHKERLSVKLDKTIAHSDFNNDFRRRVRESSSLTVMEQVAVAVANSAAGMRSGRDNIHHQNAPRGSIGELCLDTDDDS